MRPRRLATAVTTAITSALLAIALLGAPVALAAEEAVTAAPDAAALIATAPDAPRRPTIAVSIRLSRF